MSESPLYQDVMPGKIFSDLVTFINAANITLEQHNDGMLP